MVMVTITSEVKVAEIRYDGSILTHLRLLLLLRKRHRIGHGLHLRIRVWKYSGDDGLLRGARWLGLGEEGLGVDRLSILVTLGVCEWSSQS